jgi:hypothetical protein
MTTQIDRETRDIIRMTEDRHYYRALPDYRKTAAVSLAAVTLCGKHLEYVPEAVISREFDDRQICRAALNAKDADCTVLPYIPFSDVQKEAIRQFSTDTPAFVLYSFADITDAKTALEAVKADAYCIQLIPDGLMTAELCKTALQSPNADKRILGLIPEKFRTPEIKKMYEEKFGNGQEVKECGQQTKQAARENKPRQTAGVKMKF